MSYSANACLLTARHQSAALVILKQVLITQSVSRHGLALLIKFKQIGAPRKRQPSVAALVNGTTRTGPMSEANALGLTCELRLDLTLS
jgi:hypothetical protein